MRPLDRFGSLKLKLGVLIVATVAGTVVVLFLGRRAGLGLEARTLIAIVLGLLMVQVLARGMTSPLREMAAAAQAMARGDHSRRVSATSRDEVGDLARAFNAMAGELADVDRARRELVADVSHELRTPLTALQALLENLADGIEPADPQALRTALAQTERLGRLVGQLLDLSRLEAGAVPLVPRDFGVGDLLEQARRECALDSGRPVRLDVCVEPGDLRAHADPERVHQVVANLLANAVRHAESRVHMEAGRAAGSDEIFIAVTDDGPGIPPDEAERVFERYARGGDGGTGLGLAIARWIVEAHGGAIRAEQAAAGGCRMVVELPA